VAHTRDSVTKWYNFILAKLKASMLCGWKGSD